MKVELDTEIIKTISLFQEYTGTHVIDCLDDEEIWFVVAEGEYGLAVGKNGSKVKGAERLFKKPIRIVEYSKNLEKFIRNLVSEAQEIIIKKDNSVLVKLKPADRPKIIGKGGHRAKAMSKLLKRLHDIDNFKIV